MPATYEPIATTTFASGATSYTFSSIPGTYTDLVFSMSIQSTSVTDAVYMHFNGDFTNANYGYTRLTGISTVVGTTGAAFPQIADYSPNATNFMPVLVNIQNYSNATTWKSFLSRWGIASDAVGAVALVWKNTSAITSIRISVAGGNDIKTGTTMTLYGIKAA